MKKLLLGTKQAETLKECINLALMCCEGLEEYEADMKRYYELRDRIETQLNNQCRQTLHGLSRGGYSVTKSVTRKIVRGYI